MTVKRIYLIPHGDEIIDKPDEESSIMNSKITELTRTDDSQTKVIISPHGIRLSERIGIINTENFSGYFKLKTKTLRGMYKNDRNLAGLLLERTRGMSEAVGFVTSSGDLSRFPLDFGTLIPLQFFRKTPIVTIGQPRFDDRNVLIEFGKLLYRTAENYDKSVSIIMSADQAHTHSGEGPYGYSRLASDYDRIARKAMTENNFSELNGISEEFIEKARPDSFWNMMILQGILMASGKKMVFDYYYMEKYFGMMLAHSV